MTVPFIPRNVDMTASRRTQQASETISQILNNLLLSGQIVLQSYNPLQYTISAPLQALAAGKIWVGNAGGEATATALSGAITVSDTGVTTIATGYVTNAMLAGSIAASKLVGTDIATVGTITAGTWTGTTIAVDNGGTGQTTIQGAFNALSAASHIGFFGATPVVQQTGDVGTAMVTFGLMTSFDYGYSPAASSNWASTAPATLAAACDRLAAWITANGTQLATIGITTKP